MPVLLALIRLCCEWGQPVSVESQDTLLHAGFYGSKPVKQSNLFALQAVGSLLNILFVAALHHFGWGFGILIEGKQVGCLKQACSIEPAEMLKLVAGQLVCGSVSCSGRSVKSWPWFQGVPLR